MSDGCRDGPDQGQARDVDCEAEGAQRLQEPVARVLNVSKQQQV
jgi:hypothetical protein